MMLKPALVPLGMSLLGAQLGSAWGLLCPAGPLLPGLVPRRWEGPSVVAPLLPLAALSPLG